MCTIQKQKQNLIIVSMLRRKVTSHKRRRHQLRILRKRKALKLKLLLKKIMIIMKKRDAARRRKLTPKVGKILNKATQMSKDLGQTTPKIVKKIQKTMKVDNKEVAKQAEQLQLVQSLVIPPESIQKLINSQVINTNDYAELVKLTRDKLVSLIKKEEYVFIKNNIIPENIIVKIVKRLRNKNSTPIVKSPVVLVSSPVLSSPASPTPVSIPSSPSSISSPSSASSDAKSPLITITSSPNSPASSSSGKPNIIFPKKNI
jgi:hypothetical protein